MIQERSRLCMRWMNRKGSMPINMNTQLKDCERPRNR